ncbi:Uncharacterized protein GBIM_19982 [Gryllus bimaculatus]|nr:Uncharacterized protein GBIM_19982 [Gryllus bimaculatus]
MEKVKALYRKKELGVSKSTKSRLVYVLASESFLIGDIRKKFLLPSTMASEKLLAKLIKERQEIGSEFHTTGAIIDRTWTDVNIQKARVIRSVSDHGFHIYLAKARTLTSSMSNADASFVYEMADGN